MAGVREIVVIADSAAISTIQDISKCAQRELEEVAPKGAIRGESFQESGLHAEVGIEHVAPFFSNQVERTLSLTSNEVCPKLHEGQSVCKVHSRDHENKSLPRTLPRTE